MNRSCYVGLTTGYNDEEETWGGCTSQWGELVLHATAGQVWWIALANYPYEEFDFVLSWKQLHPPANDNFADATTISGASGSLQKIYTDCHNKERTHTIMIHFFR